VRLDAANLDVLVEPVLADADREDRDRAGAQREQLVADRRARVVGAVGHEHDTRYGTDSSSWRTRSTASPRWVCWASKVRPFVLSMRSAEAFMRNRRTWNFFPELGDERALRRKGADLERGARLPAAVGDRHALRVIEHDGDEVALRDRVGEQQHRPEETHDQHDERGDAERAQDPAIAPRALAADARIGHHGGSADDQSETEQER